jgi:hypothetical protein
VQQPKKKQNGIKGSVRRSLESPRPILGGGQHRRRNLLAALAYANVFNALI